MVASASSILLIVPKKRGNRVGGLGGCGLPSGEKGEGGEGERGGEEGKGGGVLASFQVNFCNVTVSSTGQQSDTEKTSSSCLLDCYLKFFGTLDMV